MKKALLNISLLTSGFVAFSILSTKILTGKETKLKVKKKSIEYNDSLFIG